MTEPLAEGHIIDNYIAINYSKTDKDRYFHFLTHVVTGSDAESISRTYSPTARMIFTSEYNFFIIKKHFNLPGNLQGMEVGKTYKIDLGNTFFFFSLIKSHYNTGSVMVLLKGEFGTVLYSGFCCYSSEWLDSPLLCSIKNQEFEVDQIYMDLMYLNNEGHFKSYLQVTQDLIQFLRQNRVKRFYLHIPSFGLEFILKAIATDLREKLIIDEAKMNFMTALGYEKYFTCNENEGRIHVISALIMKKSLCLESFGLIYLRFRTEYCEEFNFNQKINNKVYEYVMFGHSDSAQTGEMINMFSPHCVYPLQSHRGDDKPPAGLKVSEPNIHDQVEAASCSPEISLKDDQRTGLKVLNTEEVNKLINETNSDDIIDLTSEGSNSPLRDETPLKCPSHVEKSCELRDTIKSIKTKTSESLQLTCDSENTVSIRNENPEALQNEITNQTITRSGDNIIINKNSNNKDSQFLCQLNYSTVGRQAINATVNVSVNPNSDTTKNLSHNSKVNLSLEFFEPNTLQEEKHTNQDNSTSKEECTLQNNHISDLKNSSVQINEISSTGNVENYNNESSKISSKDVENITNNLPSKDIEHDNSGNTYLSREKKKLLFSSKKYFRADLMKVYYSCSNSRCSINVGMVRIKQPCSDVCRSCFIGKLSFFSLVKSKTLIGTYQKFFDLNYTIRKKIKFVPVKRVICDMYCTQVRFEKHRKQRDLNALCPMSDLRRGDKTRSEELPVTTSAPEKKSENSPQAGCSTEIEHSKNSTGTTFVECPICTDFIGGMAVLKMFDKRFEHCSFCSDRLQSVKSNEQNTITDNVYTNTNISKNECFPFNREANSKKYCTCIQKGIMLVLNMNPSNDITLLKTYTKENNKFYCNTCKQMLLGSFVEVRENRSIFIPKIYLMNIKGVRLQSRGESTVSKFIKDTNKVQNKSDDLKVHKPYTDGKSMSTDIKLVVQKQSSQSLTDRGSKLAVCNELSIENNFGVTIKKEVDEEVLTYETQCVSGVQIKEEDDKLVESGDSYLGSTLQIKEETFDDREECTFSDHEYENENGNNEVDSPGVSVTVKEEICEEEPFTVATRYREESITTSQWQTPVPAAGPYRVRPHTPSILYRQRSMTATPSIERPLTQATSYGHRSIILTVPYRQRSQPVTTPYTRNIVFAMPNENKEMFHKNVPQVNKSKSKKLTSQTPPITQPSENSNAPAGKVTGISDCIVCDECTNGVRNLLPSMRKHYLKKCAFCTENTLTSADDLECSITETEREQVYKTYKKKPPCSCYRSSIVIIHNKCPSFVTEDTPIKSFFKKGNCLFCNSCGHVLLGAFVGENECKKVFMPYDCKTQKMSSSRNTYNAPSGSTQSESNSSTHSSEVQTMKRAANSNEMETTKRLNTGQPIQYSNTRKTLRPNTSDTGGTNISANPTVTDNTLDRIKIEPSISEYPEHLTEGTTTPYIQNTVLHAFNVPSDSNENQDEITEDVPVLEESNDSSSVTIKEEPEWWMNEDDIKVEDGQYTSEPSDSKHRPLVNMSKDLEKSGDKYVPEKNCFLPS